MGDPERSCKTQKGVREARPDGLSGLLARRDGLWALTDSNRRPLPCKSRSLQITDQGDQRKPKLFL